MSAILDLGLDSTRKAECARHDEQQKAASYYSALAEAAELRKRLAETDRRISTMDRERAHESLCADEDDLTSMQPLDEAEVLVDYWLRNGEVHISGCFIHGCFVDRSCFSESVIGWWERAIAKEIGE